MQTIIGERLLAARQIGNACTQTTYPLVVLGILQIGLYRLRAQCHTVHRLVEDGYQLVPVNIHLEHAVAVGGHQHLTLTRLEQRATIEAFGVANHAERLGCLVVEEHHLAG